jgi:hypothetical protein
MASRFEHAGNDGAYTVVIVDSENLRHRLRIYRRTKPRERRSGPAQSIVHEPLINPSGGLDRLHHQRNFWQSLR